MMNKVGINKECEQGAAIIFNFMMENVYSDNENNIIVNNIL